MEVQEILENYNIYKMRIIMGEEEIEELKNEILDIKGGNIGEVRRGKGYIESNIERFIAEKEDRIDRKRRYIKGLEYKIKIIEGLVKTLKKNSQEIIEMRYYYKMSIEEIAGKKERCYRTIQKAISRSIRIMEKEYRNSKMR